MLIILFTTLMLCVLVIYAKKTILQQNNAFAKINISDSLLYWYTQSDIKKANTPKQKWVFRFNNLANSLLVLFSLIVLVSFAIVLLSLA